VNHQEFCWWLGGVLASSPMGSSMEAKSAALEVVRTQLASVMLIDKAAARMTEAQGLANMESRAYVAPVPRVHLTAQEQLNPFAQRKP
jgi:hypothetical protein